MKRLCLLLIFLSTVCFGQTDSVVVMGRISHLTPALYRQSPQVTISRNNILQATRELVRPAPLSPDGRFRVAMPLIFPYEEMYFNFNNITTAFLASAGTVTIDIDADSLFAVAVPFRFKGANAAVNQQYARYKAFEAGFSEKVDNKKLSRQASSMGDLALYNLLLTTNTAPMQAFAEREKPLPLLTTWLTNIARYNSAAFMYEKAMVEQDRINVALTDSLRPSSDNILTAARAIASNRFADYFQQQATARTSTMQNGGLPVARLAAILKEHTPRLTDNEQSKLAEIETKKTARTGDIRFFEQLIRRNQDTIQRLINYESLIHRATVMDGDSNTVDVQYLTAYWLAHSLPGLSLNFSQLLYQFARPRVQYSYWKESLTELYGLQVKNRDEIEKAVARLPKDELASNVELTTGVFVTYDKNKSGETLLTSAINANRGKVIYLLLWDPNEEQGRQAVLEAQRLKEVFNPRDFALMYVSVSDANSRQFIPEFLARNQVKGDHLLVTDTQYTTLLQQLQAVETTTATIIGPTGKFSKRNAPLPDKVDEIRQLVRKAVTK